MCIHTRTHTHLLTCAGIKFYSPVELAQLLALAYIQDYEELQTLFLLPLDTHLHIVSLFKVIILKEKNSVCDIQSKTEKRPTYFSIIFLFLCIIYISVYNICQGKKFKQISVFIIESFFFFTFSEFAHGMFFLNKKEPMNSFVHPLLYNHQV